jgi:hypothetical protein
MNYPQTLGEFGRGRYRLFFDLAGQVWINEFRSWTENEKLAHSLSAMLPPSKLLLGANHFALLRELKGFSPAKPSALIEDAVMLAYEGKELMTAVYHYLHSNDDVGAKQRFTALMSILKSAREEAKESKIRRIDRRNRKRIKENYKNVQSYRQRAYDAIDQAADLKSENDRFRQAMRLVASELGRVPTLADIRHRHYSHWTASEVSRAAKRAEVDWLPRGTPGRKSAGGETVSKIRASK